MCICNNELKNGIVMCTKFFLRHFHEFFDLFKEDNDCNEDKVKYCPLGDDHTLCQYCGINHKECQDSFCQHGLSEVNFFLLKICEITFLTKKLQKNILITTFFYYFGNFANIHLKLYSLNLRGLLLWVTK